MCPNIKNLIILGQTLNYLPFVGLAKPKWKACPGRWSEPENTDELTVARG